MSGYYFLIFLAVAGLIASFDPLILSIFLSLAFGLRGQDLSNNKQRLVIWAYIATYSLAIAAISALIVSALNAAPLRLTVVLAIITAVAANLWGLVHIYNYFWYRSFGKTPKVLHYHLHKRTNRINSIEDIGTLAAITIGASIYNMLIIISSFSVLMFLISSRVLYWPLALGLVFSLPLFLINSQLARGIHLSTFVKWKENSKQIFELNLGLLSIFLGWLIFLSLNGVFR